MRPSGLHGRNGLTLRIQIQEGVDSDAKCNTLGRSGSPRTTIDRKTSKPADIGHWEGDLIICKRTRPMLVLHERKSRVMLAARLTGKTAAETISVMLAVFGRINPALRKSITFDNLITRLRQLEFPLRTNTEHYDL